MRGFNWMCAWICVAGGMLAWPSSSSAQLTITAMENVTGTVESVSPGRVVVKSEQGETFSCRIQAKDAEGVALTGGALLRYPATVKVSGRLSTEDLKPGQAIRFEGEVNRLGRTNGEVAALWMVDGSDKSGGITVKKHPVKSDGFATCEVVGEFSRIVNKRLIVKVASNAFTKQANLAFALQEGAAVQFESDDYRRAGAGAKVTKLVAARLNTGDVVVKELEIESSAEVAVKTSAADKLAVKYRSLSDDPVAPRPIRSQHFMFVSDISDRQAAILMDKLETMVGLLSNYFGRAPRGMVEGFIVRDLNGWPNGMLTEPAGIAKIQERAGICFSLSLGNKRRAILYSCDDHGVVQHEATHAFCTMTFGSTGPTWLAEGVAEMGNYWKQDELAVDISPVVLSYIQNSPSKKQLLDIAVPGRTASGTWQDYAWRWALCHLLAYSPNYQNRFKPLAVALMDGQQNVSFESVYGPVAKEISFEYDLFLKTLDNGYRADLCAWQWNVRPKPLQGERRMQKAIKAKYGWQASGLELVEGARYDVAGVGYWKIAEDGSEVDADGDQQGRGKLMGVIFTDYQLSEPFEIGRRTAFTAPVGGHLYLRCQEAWNQLADNDGELTVHFRLAPEPNAEE